MDKTHLFVFHSVSNWAHGKCSINSTSSAAPRFQIIIFFCKSKKLYDIHVT